MPWLPDLHSPEDDLWFFAHVVLPDQSVTVAKADDRIVGFIAVSEGWLNHLYVAPDRVGQGIGNQLLQTAFATAETLSLWVFQGNINAIGFYRSHGFVVAEETDGAGNEEHLPDARMVWTRPNA